MSVGKPKPFSEDAGSFGLPEVLEAFFADLARASQGLAEHLEGVTIPIEDVEFELTFVVERTTTGKAVFEYWAAVETLKARTMVRRLTKSR